MRTLQVGSVFLLMTIAALTFSCSKKSSPTQPGGGGGGTIETFESGTLSPGAIFVHTFTNTGSFGYRCRIHSPGMVGTVNVVASGASDSVVSVITPGMTFSPSTVTVNVGGYVKWNISGTNHTVTRP